MLHPHSEHRFPAPSTKLPDLVTSLKGLSVLRTSLSGTFLQTLPELVTDATKGTHLISAQLSTDAVSALIRPWKQHSVQESRRDQEEGGELDSYEELDNHLRVQARSRGGRWCWTLKRAQERSREARWSWAQDVGLYFASVVPQQLCYGHCLCDSAPHSS